ISAGKATEDALLIVVDSELGSEGISVTAGFDLDETEGVIVPGDEVDVATKFRRLPSSGDDGIAATAQIKERFALTKGAGLKMGSRAGTVQGVKTTNSPSLRTEPEAGGRSSKAGGPRGESHGIQDRGWRADSCQICGNSPRKVIERAEVACRGSSSPAKAGERFSEA
ncbi:MAG TPA: hypothetical protein VK638_26575, partial [Edaphobacter sp.]|nr:hypothetical protein [Edaphobacter sp.]